LNRFRVGGIALTRSSLPKEPFIATEQFHTYSAMCISRCGGVAPVEDGRLTKVNADPAHPNGCICVKGTAAPEIVYSPDRLRTPMKRTRPKGDPDPGWIPISWDQAMLLVRVNPHGFKKRGVWVKEVEQEIPPDSVATYHVVAVDADQ
jgi:anaerobic selenocysteine-containing dehydrogenase